jgi:hypothetical protein
MKTAILALVMAASTAQAQVVITNQGNYTVQSAGSTTYVTGPNHTTVPIAVPVTVNPATGIGQVHTPQGSYLVQRSSSGTTTVIQTSRGK